MRYLNPHFLRHTLRKKFPGPVQSVVKYRFKEAVGNDGIIVHEVTKFIVGSPIFEGLDKAQRREIVTATLKMKIKGLDKEIDEMNIETVVVSECETDDDDD